MPIYHRLGRLPHKRHTQFRQPDGSLYHEQLFGTIGFDGMSSLLYHVHPPTAVTRVGESRDVSPRVAEAKNMRARKLRGFGVSPVDDALRERTPVLVNADVHVSLAAPRAGRGSGERFYKNADADELLFVHRGSGTLETLLGDIAFVAGDYLLVPRGTIYRMRFDDGDELPRLLIVESFHPVYTPKRYRNHFGQLLEHSPYCERDYKLPTYREPVDARGEFVVDVKKQGTLTPYTYATHPFDVVGWDGYNYPYGLSIHDFEPITGRVHQPPPVHQTFETKAFVVCSFVPRKYDYHPLAIPAPYNHSNIDSDEVLYYVDGDFMSRNDIGPGVITLHPGGIPHGPHPGAYERSIGKEDTDELAVMVDTFRPLQVTEQALALDDGAYWSSWVHE